MDTCELELVEMETSFTERLGRLDWPLVVSNPDDTECDGAGSFLLFSSALRLDLRNFQAAFLIIIGELLEDPSRRIY